MDKPNQKGNSFSWGSVWQLILSILVILLFWGIALSFFLINFNSLINAPERPPESISLLLMVAGFAFIGLLMIPSAVFSFFRLLNIPLPISIRLPRPGLLFLLFLVLLGFGYLISKNASLIWFFLPPIHVMAIGFAALWMITLGIRGLSIGSNQLKWGIFNLGLVAAPVLSLLFEIVVVVIIGVIGIAYLGREPGFSTELTNLYERYMSNPNLSLDIIFQTLEPYLSQPTVIYLGLVVIALLVPLIEELIKPIGVWLLVGRESTPTQGFVAGILSGGGFALFENLTLSATSGEDWALVVGSRIGTSIIHIITTGLTGWALASAWSKKKFGRLLISYLAAVAIHALWNGLVILSIVPVYLPNLSNYPDLLENIGIASPFGFLVLLAGSFILLIGSNYKLRHAIIQPVVNLDYLQDQGTEINFK